MKRTISQHILRDKPYPDTVTTEMLWYEKMADKYLSSARTQKFLRTCPADPLQQYIQMGTHDEQVVFIPQGKVRSASKGKQSNSPYLQRTSPSHLIDGEKAFDRTQHPFRV